MDLFTTVMICSMFHNNAVVNAIIQTDAQQNPFAVTVVSESGEAKSTQAHFKTAVEASSYAKKQLAAGNHVYMGMMQISSGWLDKLSKQGVQLDDLWFPCENVVIGSDLINQAEAYCATETHDTEARDQCALSFYRTGDSKKGIDYASQILTYAAAHPFNLKNSEIKPVAAIDYQAYGTDYELPVPNFSTAKEK